LTPFASFRNLQAVIGPQKRKTISPLSFLLKSEGCWLFVVFLHQDEKSDLTGAHVAQLVEHVLGKDEVISSILIMGSI
jgi:hypothetical protein